VQCSLPLEQHVYVSDSAHSPYGERSTDYVIDRSLHIADWLRSQHHIKALVVACNTATAAAIEGIRHAHPDLPIIGVEPALKPALELSHTRRIGVIATRVTANSAKFKLLLEQCSRHADFVVQPCDGLAAAIERQDAAQVRDILRYNTQQMGLFGHDAHAIDTLVLGCTHYSLERQVVQDMVGASIALAEPGLGVANQLKHLLCVHGLNQSAGQPNGTTQWHATGSQDNLMAAVSRWITRPPATAGRAV
jgi:glutamate racemase